jgi:magnesium transporter
MSKKRRTNKSVIPSKKNYNGNNTSIKIEAQTFNYDETGFLTEISEFDFSKFKFDITEKDNTWFNLHGLHNEEIIEQIGTFLSLDSLVIQNILDTTIRPKVQEYENYIFFSVKTVNGKIDNLAFDQISFVLGPNYLLSFQERRGQHFGHIRERIKGNKGIICHMGHDYLLYTLLEAVLENYYLKLDESFDEIEKLDYKYIHANLKSFNIEIIEDIKIQLNRIKKSLAPIREFLTTVEKTDHKAIKQTNIKYFIDLKDHTNILLEELDFQTKQLETAANVFFSLQSQKLNEIMKTLTIISSIFIPITFVAGIYGMNFEYMPELKHPSGYFIILGVMLVLVIGPLIYFKKKNWF